MSGKDTNGSEMRDLSRDQHSAVQRLQNLKAHQWSLLAEIRHNWRGWLGSLVFHAAVVAVLMTITWTIFVEEREYFITPPVLTDVPELKKHPVDSLFERRVETKKYAAPEVPAEVIRPYPGYTELEPGVPDYVTVGGHLIGPWGKVGGGGDGLGDWPIYTRKLRDEGLDVMFVFDSTGSMAGILLEVRTRIRQLMKFVTYHVPNARLGLVTYRDKRKYDLEDYQYTVKMIPLKKLSELDKLERFLGKTEASGGGDIPEAVYEGVHAAITQAGWGPTARKVVIVFGDAPPRPENDGLVKIYELCRTWHKRTGGIVSCIDTSGHARLMEEFRQMAREGGGDSTFINKEQEIMKHLAVFIFGAKWEKKVREFEESDFGKPKDTILID
ncbi:MAG: hypothetical protein AMS16_02040 [Planctomycetes bacterium DG_58]|nr:MAG: hypothetical protein AMS16_02040 [Planctomycetes bacterium DG_58]KPL02191.1 MAG: hypothetical protein AMK75_03110 [Planctomycetes bacterium SM23_65]